MPATSRASPKDGTGDSANDGANDGGMVTVEAAIALCAFVTVLAMVLAGMSMVLDQIRCTDAAREAARLVARGEQDHAADAVREIAPAGATFVVTAKDEGIVVAVRDPAAAGGLLPGVHVAADAYAVPEPDAVDPEDDPAGTTGDTGPPDTVGETGPASTAGHGPAARRGADRSSRSAEGTGR
jgi:Flp pilus assembly protein TadG